VVLVPRVPVRVSEVVRRFPLLLHVAVPISDKMEKSSNAKKMETMRFNAEIAVQ
jgi:hypothetical protein